MRPLEFTTTDIELAAALMVALDRKPVIQPGVDLVEFTFPMTAATESVITKYAAGNLVQEVRRLANYRGWLYRRIREVKLTGKVIRP